MAVLLEGRRTKAEILAELESVRSAMLALATQREQSFTEQGRQNVRPSLARLSDLRAHESYLIQSLDTINAASGNLTIGQPTRVLVRQ
jgi:hypothetical protein